jgi:hypothetical protein
VPNRIGTGVDSKLNATRLHPTATSATIAPSTSVVFTSPLDFGRTEVDNVFMVISGHVQNGVVVLDGNPALPEGAVVAVSYPVPVPIQPAGDNRRIEVPLVRTGQPGSVNLTGHQIAEILDEEDAAPGR